MFKLIKYFIFWIVPALLFVQGCSSHDSLRQVPPQEIIALGKDPQNFYIVSADYAFQFPAEQLLPVEAFLETPLGKKITAISAEVTVNPDQVVSGTLRIGIGANAQLSLKQISQLINDYGFSQSHPSVRSEITQAYETQKDLYIYTKQYYFKAGEIIEIENRTDLLAHNQLKTPISLSVRHIDRVKILNMKVIEGGMWLVVLAPLIPVILVDQVLPD